MESHKTFIADPPRALDNARARRASLARAWQAVAVALSVLSAVACAGRSSSIRSRECCAAYQRSDALPDQPRPGVLRLAIGGDSRDDHSQVLPWAFTEARRRGANAFLFLGDLKLTRLLDKLSATQLAKLDGVPFYPVIGNHEVEFLGAFRLPSTAHAVKEFKEDFLAVPGLKVAPIAEVVAYSADLGGRIHFIALDNVSRPGEGFGAQQLAWLAADLQAASSTKKVIFVGMHKALARNPVTTHAMDEDGASAIADSDAALALFKQYKVAMVFVSHSHMYASYNQDGIEVRLTGGLGAPLVKGLAEADGGFHHFLLLDLPALDDEQAPVQVEVVKFHEAPDRDEQDESLEAVH